MPPAHDQIGRRGIRGPIVRVVLGAGLVGLVGEVLAGCSSLAVHR